MVSLILFKTLGQDMVESDVDIGDLTEYRVYRPRSAAYDGLERPLITGRSVSPIGWRVLSPLTRLLTQQLAIIFLFFM